MTEQQDLVKILRDLAATCRDAEEGFNKAAKGVHDDELRASFDEYSRERSDFAVQLDEAARRRARQYRTWQQPIAKRMERIGDAHSSKD
jgi:uncharacterized protein (TIGR02284 family)